MIRCGWDSLRYVLCICTRPTHPPHLLLSESPAPDSGRAGGFPKLRSTGELRCGALSFSHLSDRPWLWLWLHSGSNLLQIKHVLGKAPLRLLSLWNSFAKESEASMLRICTIETSSWKQSHFLLLKYKFFSVLTFDLILYVSVTAIEMPLCCTSAL